MATSRCYFILKLCSLHFTSFTSLSFTIVSSMTYTFPTNGDCCDNWVKASKSSTVKQYIDWLTVYESFCREKGVVILDKQCVKDFLVFRHDIPKIE